MNDWEKTKTFAKAWYSSDHLAAGAKYKARLMGPTFLVIAAVGAIATREWGMVALCAAVGTVLTAYSLRKRDRRGQ